MPFHARWRHFVVGGARPVGRARRADRMAVAGREGARGLRSRDHLGAARCRRRRRVAYRDRGDRTASSRAPKGLALASLRMFEAGALLGRSGRSAARRRRAADAARRRRSSPTAFQAWRTIRWSASRAAPRCSRRLGAAVAAQPRRVRARGSRAAGRAVRSSRGAGRGRTPAGAAHPRSAARRISARSGRAG